MPPCFPTYGAQETYYRRSCRDTTHLNRHVEGAIFGKSHIIFRSVRERKSVLISVCETHLQLTRETVFRGGETPHMRGHRAAEICTQLYLYQSRDCEKGREGRCTELETEGKRG